MEAKKKNIAGIIAISLGGLLLVGGIITLVVINNKNKREEEELDLELAAIDNKVGGGGSGGTGSGQSGNMGFSTDQVKAMQSYLLQLGIQHNNQYIIDAIQLTGGVDGQIGSGFHAAVQEAKDKGYLTGYEDILKRLGY